MEPPARLTLAGFSRPRRFSSLQKPSILCRVEEGRGSVEALSQWPRLPSPLIKPDVRISRIRLSDRFHREAHDVEPIARGAFAAASSIFASRHSSFGQVLPRWVFAGQWPITLASPSSRAHQKSGSFPPPELPGLDGHTTLSDSRPVHRRKRCRSRDLRPDGSPPTTRFTLPACRAQYPGGSNGCMRRLLRHPCRLP